MENMIFLKNKNKYEIINNNDILVMWMKRMVWNISSMIVDQVDLMPHFIDTVHFNCL